MFKIFEGYHLIEALHVQKAAKRFKQSHYLRMVGCAVVSLLIACLPTSVFGKKWQPGIFIGYLKNLGTSKPIVDQQYGVGLDVDQLLSTNIQLSYNLPHWKIGMELTPSTAWYGKTNLEDGRVIDTHSVTNYRFLAVMMYIF